MAPPHGRSPRGWRLARWRGISTVAEPLLLVRHIAYFWVCSGAALLGLSVVNASMPPSGAIHALTVGAFSTMILAVMTRATRGHTGRALSGDRSTTLIYLAITLAAITRITAGFVPGAMTPMLVCSGCLWIAAFGGFVLRYGPMLLGRAASAGP